MHIRIAVLISLAILIGLLIAGRTHWLAVSDGMALVRPDSYDFEDLARPPSKGDFDQELSDIVCRPLPDFDYMKTEPVPPLIERVKQLHALAARYPNQPALYAAAASFEMRAVNYLYNPNQCLIEKDNVCNFPPPVWDPFIVSSLVSDTESACRLEPNNGCFAMLESYAYFAARRDSDGVAAYNRSASCKDWNEHDFEVFKGAMRRLPGAKSRDVFMIDAVRESMSSNWAWAKLRDLMRVILTHAAKAEIDGDIDQGVRLRRSMRRVGVLMCDIARSDTAAFVGSVIVSAANSRICGKWAAYPKGADRATLTAKSAAQFLRAHGYEADAADALRETTRTQKAYASLMAAIKIDDYWSLIYDRCILRAIELSAIMLTLWAIAVWVLLRIPSIAAARASRLNTSAFIVFATVALAVIDACCGLLLLRVAQTRMFHVFMEMWTDSSRAYRTADSHLGIALLLAVCAIPFLIALIAAIVACVKRRRAAVTILLAWRGALPWVVCALVASYAALAIPTVKQNDRMRSFAIQQAENAPRATAREQGFAWPVR